MITSMKSGSTTLIVNTIAAVHSITLSQGVWFITGLAVFITTGNVVWFQVGTSFTTRFDDYSYVTQYTTTTPTGTAMMLPIPMRYCVCTTAAQVLNMVLYVNGCNVNVAANGANSTLRAIRIA